MFQVNVRSFLPASLHPQVEEKQVVKTTIGRLIKMQSKLDAELSKHQGSTFSAKLGREFSYSTGSGQSHEVVVSTFLEQQSLNRQEVVDQAQREVDAFEIKSVLHEKNASYGQDKRQAMLALLKKRKDDLVSCLSTLQASLVTTVPLSQLTETHLSDKDAEAVAVRAKSGSVQTPCLNLSVSLADIAEVQEMVDQLNQLITETEDERDAINARTKVTLELYPVTMKVLGLKPAVPSAGGSSATGGSSDA
jgi:hypothetical protein